MYCYTFSLDLHVLSPPPAFALSQDQTLQLKNLNKPDKDEFLKTSPCQALEIKEFPRAQLQNFVTRYLVFKEQIKQGNKSPIAQPLLRGGRSSLAQPKLIVNRNLLSKEPGRPVSPTGRCSFFSEPEAFLLRFTYYNKTFPQSQHLFRRNLRGTIIIQKFQLVITKSVSFGESDLLVASLSLPLTVTNDASGYSREVLRVGATSGILESFFRPGSSRGAGGNSGRENGLRFSVAPASHSYTTDPARRRRSPLSR